MKKRRLKVFCLLACEGAKGGMQSGTRNHMGQGRGDLAGQLARELASRLLCSNASAEALLTTPLLRPHLLQFTRGLAVDDPVHALLMMLRRASVLRNVKPLRVRT